MITPERGKLYLVNHSSGIIEARFLNVREIASRAKLGSRSITRAGISYQRRASTRYIFRNIRTERDIELKSRVKILREIEGCSE